LAIKPADQLDATHARLGAIAIANGELATAVGMEPSAVSHQLRQLRYPHVAELLDQAVFHVQHLRLGARQPLDISAEAS
jgi:ArsR family transcriptional regulator, nickel/cobalt-responsive transcriptional repressor